MASAGGVVYETTKIWKYKGELLGITGNLAMGAALVEWYRDDTLNTPFPMGQTPEDSATLVVIDKRGLVWEYDSCPSPFQLEGPFCALGSGAEGGMVAMSLGCTAVEAVEVVSKYNNGCGMGVDVLRLKGK